MLKSDIPSATNFRPAAVVIKMIVNLIVTIKLAMIVVGIELVTLTTRILDY